MFSNLINQDNSFKRLCEVVSSAQPMMNELLDESFFNLLTYHRALSIVNIEKSYESFEDFQQRLKFNSFKQIIELKIIDLELRQQKIDYILIKGLPLSKLLYDSFSARSSKDIDIIVSELNVVKVYNLLKQFGYILTPSSLIDECGKKILDNEIYYNFSAYHPDRKIEIEVHWRWGQNTNYFTLTFEEALKSSRVENIDGVKVNTLSHEYNFLYLIYHLGRTEVLRLRHFVDIDRYLRLNILNIEVVKKLALEFGLLNSLCTTLKVCEALFSTPVPEIKTSFFINILTSLNKHIDIFILKHANYTSYRIIKSHCILKADSIREIISALLRQAFYDSGKFSISYKRMQNIVKRILFKV